MVTKVSDWNSNPGCFFLLVSEQFMPPAHERKRRIQRHRHSHKHLTCPVAVVSPLGEEAPFKINQPKRGAGCCCCVFCTGLLRNGLRTRVASSLPSSSLGLRFGGRTEQRSDPVSWNLDMGALQVLRLLCAGGMNSSIFCLSYNVRARKSVFVPNLPESLALL